jgi:hypothetical protein
MVRAANAVFMLLASFDQPEPAAAIGISVGERAGLRAGLIEPAR